MTIEEAARIGREIAESANMKIGDEPLDVLSHDHFYVLVYELARHQVLLKALEDETLKNQSQIKGYVEEVEQMRVTVIELKRRVAEYTGKAEA